MSFFKILFLAAIAFIAAVAVFLGFVMIVTSLQNGSIMMSYMSSGSSVSETVTRAGDPARFWKLVLTIGVLPLVLGALTLRFAVRKLRAG
jgi:hypothetical protein